MKHCDDCTNSKTISNYDYSEEIVCSVNSKDLGNAEKCKFYKKSKIIIGISIVLIIMIVSTIFSMI